jgi:glycosyltransferase involved in cell wall biosynthesis
MRIAFIVHAGVWGGAEVHAVELAKVLLARGHEVSIVGLDQPSADLYRNATGDIPELKFAVVPIARGRFWKMAKELQKLACDSCIFIKGTLHTGSFALELACRWSFKQYVSILQFEPPRLAPRASRRYFGGLVTGIGLWWYKQVFSGYLRSLPPKVVIAVSKAISEQLIGNYRFPKGKVAVVHNGVDPGKFTFNPNTRLKTRERWRLSPDALVFGSVGRLNKVKGLETAIEAFAQVIKRNSDRDIALVLVGDGPERETLEELARKHGVHAKVHFPGFTSEPWREFSAIDFFVLPSLREGLPIALLEAMACECVPIATQIDGVIEVLTEPDLGWLVPPGDASFFAEAMEAALNTTKEVKEQRSKLARCHVVRNFDSGVEYQRIAAILENGSDPKEFPVH